MDPNDPSKRQNDESPQPVAYDSQGRPLYAAPPSGQVKPHVVHLSRAVEPIQQDISPEVKARHKQSTRDYPHLNLSEAEFIISAIRRHPIGLVPPVLVTSLGILVTAVFMFNYSAIMEMFGVFDPPGFGSIFLIGTLLILLFLIGGYIAIWVYLNNRFFLTNESVIQEIQTSLFSRHEQTVSLANIEDASYQQHGIIQTLLNYGAIRLSTEGDETTYRFHYVADPKRQISILNNAVEAFKNGRPVTED